MLIFVIIMSGSIRGLRLEIRKSYPLRVVIVEHGHNTGEKRDYRGRHLLREPFFVVQ